MNNNLRILVLSILFAGNISALTNDKSIEKQSVQPIHSANVNNHKNPLHGNGMCFTPNKGQIADSRGKPDMDILYKGDGGGANVYLRTTGISYVYSDMGEVMNQINEQAENLVKAGTITEANEQKKKQELLQKQKIRTHRVDMDFEGCNKNITMINEDEVDGYQNFYYAHCPDGILNVKQYNKVTCKNIYNNIDVEYDGNPSNGLKYNLIVQAHADPHQIQLHWKGAENIYINHEGNLIIKTSINEFTESLPKVYQIIDKKIVDIKTKYVLTPVSKGEAIIKFSFSIYNSSFPLIIDPWVTYYGGAGDEMANSIATDASGNVYVAGNTTSIVSIASGGSQNTYGGIGDAFLVKFNSAGVRLWATYYGGTNSDYANSVTTDISGNVYMAGQTSSTTGISFGGFQNIFAGANDAFLVKFNPTGVRLWATYYGGTDNDPANSVTTDTAGNVYVAGETSSTTGIASGGFQNIYGGASLGGDAFLVKFNPGGARLWATYYGGSDDDAANSVVTDISGNVYMTGYTYSNASIASGGFQNTIGGGADAFLVKFNPGGTRLWATYYGGTGGDFGTSVSGDTLGNVYVAGLTFSPAGIASGGFQNIINGSSDAFLVKFNPTGMRLWATYLGGNNQDYAMSVAIDTSSNDVYISGDTYSLNFPVTPCAWQQTLAGGISEDSFVAHFTPVGQIICSSYAGGSAIPNDENGRIALYGCYVYLTGFTSGSYPVTSGAHQTVFGGVRDAFIAQLYKNSCGFDNKLNITFNNTNNVCPGATVSAVPNYTGCDTTGITYLWTFTGGTPTSSTAQLPVIIYSIPGTYAIKLVISTPCGMDSVTNTVTIIPCACTLTGQFTKGSANCAGCGCKEWVMITATGGASPYNYTWPDGYNKRYKNNLCPGDYIINIKDKNGCNVNINLSTP